MYYVEIYYQGVSREMDAAIRKAMRPLKENGSGYFIPGNRRDIGFVSRNKLQLVAATKRVKRVPGAHCTHIMREPD
jgi:hypothetical protein